MVKKYEVPEEEPQMVSEPVVTVPVEMVQKVPVYNYTTYESRNKRSNADIARTLAQTPEEYEDMKAHDFYSKGAPFPEQPQTWDEVWEEVDKEEETYLDEAEANKAMNRLWSVLS